MHILQQLQLPTTRKTPNLALVSVKYFQKFICTRFGEMHPDDSNQHVIREFVFRRYELFIFPGIGTLGRKFNFRIWLAHFRKSGELMVYVLPLDAG